MLMPSWLYWLRNSYPSLEIRTVITPSALRFVTQTSLSVFGGRPPELDRWSDEPQSTARHVDLSHWADTVIVHPATFHFTSGFAPGAADTPTMLALQCTNAPVALAPALPPGALTSPAWKLHTAALAARKNVTVVPPHPGVSMTTGRQDAATAAPLPEVIHAVETLRTSLRERHRGRHERRGTTASPGEGHTRMTATELVDSFGTGFLHTTVHRLPGSGYSWRRGPGPDHPTTLAAPANSVQSTIGTPAIASVKISWPTPAGTELHYAVPGAATLARLLWADLPHHLLQRLETIVHNTGELLSHLHHLPRPASLADTPPNGPLRLAHWLDTGQGPRDAPRLHHALRETLGDTRWAELRAWCTTLTTTGHPDPALLHGAPSTGTLVLSPTLSESALLTGEDLATGPASLMWAGSWASSWNSA